MNHSGSRSEADEQARVRVWFGRHVIATYVADPGEAERYARAMGQRFAGLRVTIDDETSRFDPLLPQPVWWDRAPLRQR